MDMFFLEKPSIERKNDALDYIKEHQELKSKMNGIGGLDKCLNNISYEEWLLELKKRENIEYLKSINRCPARTYFVIRERDNRIIGMTNIRYDISNERLKSGMSHIGYGIRPTERGNGYAKITLFLGLLEEAKLGEKRILLDCDADNIASDKTIRALGGELITDDFDCEGKNRYWIDVTRTIDKYKSVYLNNIKSDKTIVK